MNNNQNTPYTETKIKDFITDIEIRVDKNGKEYWIIHTKNSNFLAHSRDYKLVEKTRSLLANFPEQLVGKYCCLKIREGVNEKDWGKVIEIELV